MLMAVKNQIKVSLLTVKYATMRAMLNKTTFLTNVLFMILNNATFLIQWIILFSLKEDVGGYTFKQVIFLISAITADISVSALGDIIYGYILLCIYGITVQAFILFTLFSICGGFILASLSVILSSLSFWFSKSDSITDTANSMMTHFATYPDGIFKGITKIILYTIIPVGLVNYIPVRVITKFEWRTFLTTIGGTIIFVILAFTIFYRGLRKYSSSNLMIAKI